MSTDVPTTPVPATDHLPDDPAILKRMILELLATLQQERADKEQLRHRLDLLLRRLYGPRQERFDPNQPLLFEEPAAVAAPDMAQASPPEVESPRRARPHGRRRLPANLPREPQHHVLSEAERVCAACGRVRVEIGIDRSEQLEYRPASLFVIEHCVHKYACPCCGPNQQGLPASAPAQDEELPPLPSSVAAARLPPRPGVVIAAMKPAMPIAKGLPGPGLLAHLIVSKAVDHLPLYRLERVYERQGYFVPRSTLCDWFAASAELLRPLYDLMVSHVLRSQVIHTDDTPVKMQDPPRALITARLWTYLGDADHPYTVFDFTPTRQRDGPQQFLDTYRGYLQADAFSGYDRLYLPCTAEGTARITEVACNAHARRKFYEARTSDAACAHQALAYYGQLYEIERRAKELDDAQRLRLRRDLAVPILDQLHTWLEVQRREALPKSPMGEAIGYALNNWTALVRYTETGYLVIDNNVAEREMKRIAIGRKNWLFIGSKQGGQTAAVLFSFTSTCQRLGVEPWAYLQDVLPRLPAMPAGQLGDLLPDHWQATRQTKTATRPSPATESTNRPVE